MKFFLPILYSFVIFILNDVYGQPGEWVWMHGSNATGSFGNYGTQGVPSPGNDPSSVYEPIRWTDLNGNFWLYGGYGNGGTKNDLWKYDPVTNEWTWISGTNTPNDPGVYGVMGIPSPLNRPPSKGWGGPSWTDNNGNLWLFAGGSGTTNLNDLWKYDISSNEWTWMKGSNSITQTPTYGNLGIPDTANNPGSRWECPDAWKDNSGDLWVFGGYSGSANYNDLWRFNIASNSWTWMKGSNLPNQNGMYGIQGIEDPLNTPGARGVYNHWIDSVGNFWIFGGWTPNNISYNDLWRFNVNTNNWTWISGSDTTSSNGNFGTKCILSPQNIPSGRFENRISWADQLGNFWFFSGGVGSFNLTNDLWKYCIAINQWVWINGDSTYGSSGNWGTLGIPSPTNHPDGRAGSPSWKDINGNFYFFGGCGQLWPASYNDLWKFTIDTSCAPCNSSVILPTANFISSNSSFCSGDCISFTNFSQHSNSYQWFFPGGTPSSDTSANPNGICYFNSGAFDVTLIASNNYGSDTLTLPNFITIYPQVPFSALTQNGDTLFSIPGYPSYEWYDGSTIIPGATNYNYVATHSGNYSVVVTDSNGCFATAQMLNVIASVNNINSDNIDFNVQYSSGNLLLKINSSNTILSDIEIADGIGNLIYQNKITVEKGRNEKEISGLNLSDGVYFVKLMNLKETMTKKIFIQSK